MMENESGSSCGQVCTQEECCANELKECQASLKEARDRQLYLQAEFDNFRKRVEKERAQAILYGQETIIDDILPIVDDFERALEQLRSQELPAEAASHLTGIELIAKSFHKFLKKHDVEEITENEVFDPQIHEAIMQVKSDKPSGSVVLVLKKGYRHKGHILRPAQVSVAE